MHVDGTRKTHPSHHPGSEGPEQAQKKHEHGAVERRQHAASRQQAMLETASSSKLASQPSRQSKIMNQLNALARRYPEAGVNLAIAANAASKTAVSQKSSPIVAASQAFVRQALASKPGMAAQLLRDLHLRNVDAAVRQLVEQGTAGYTGRALYSRGTQLIARLREFKAEQQGDIAGMVAAGDTLDQAIAKEHKELAWVKTLDSRPGPAASSTSRSSTAFDSQVKSAVARGKALASAAAAIRTHAAGAWRDLPHITRAAEAELGLVKLPTLLGEAAYAALDTAQELSTKPLKQLTHEASVTKDYLSGSVSDLQDRTRFAYTLLISTLNDVESAANSFTAAMAEAPPDVLSAQAAQGRANAACKHVDLRVQTFYSLATKLATANDEFDHQVFHVAKEVLIAAAGLGLGSGLAAEASKATAAAKHATTGVARALHLAKHLGQEGATDAVLRKGVETVEKAAKSVKHAVE